jgi:hypothetical protein
MNRRSCIAALAVLLGACVPVKQTYYEAIGGSVNTANPMHCPPDRFFAGNSSEGASVMLIIARQEPPTVSFTVWVGPSHEFTMTPWEIDIHSSNDPTVHTPLPLKFYVPCLDSLFSRRCGERVYETGPLGGPPPGQTANTNIEHHAEIIIPKDYVDGFAFDFPQTLVDGRVIPTPHVKYRRTRQVLPSGTFGCN